MTQSFILIIIHEVNLDDKSGKPAILALTQEQGYIYLQFQDNSLCEEGFAIERINSEDSSDVYVIAPNYYFYLDNECGDKLAPNKDYSDDLRRSNLNVGQKYRYCVSAIAPNYMAVDPITDDAYSPFKKSSENHVLSIQFNG